MWAPLWLSGQPSPWSKVSILKCSMPTWKICLQKTSTILPFVKNSAFLGPESRWEGKIHREQWILCYLCSHVILPAGPSWSQVCHPQSFSPSSTIPSPLCPHPPLRALPGVFCLPLSWKIWICDLKCQVSLWSEGHLLTSGSAMSWGCNLDLCSLLFSTCKMGVNHHLESKDMSV